MIRVKGKQSSLESFTEVDGKQEVCKILREIAMVILGIDIGSTSVKTALVRNNVVICSKSRRTEAEIAILDHPEFNEQDVSKIVACVNECIEDLQRDVGLEIMSEVANIAVCGQMHGCVMWNSNTTTIETNFKVSTLITWRDARCNAAFLNSLPCSSTANSPLSTGFGCATLLWLKKFKETYMCGYNCCGTIADYLVALLVKVPKAVMSTQNANSWGYFNIATESWDTQVMQEAEFPTHMLPLVVPPQTVAGKMAHSLCGIPAHANVFVALGDMQCSILSCQVAQNEADGKISPVTRVPYFHNNDVLTAASLNGGAVFHEYVRMLTRWTNQFADDVTEDRIFESLMRSEQDVPTPSSATCVPCLFGERHDPELRASFSNVGSQDLDLTSLARLLARGVLSNLRLMFERGAPGMIGKIRRVWACGGAFSSNSLFREELQHRVFNDVAISFDRRADAAYGAALSIAENSL